MVARRGKVLEERPTPGSTGPLRLSDGWWKLVVATKQQERCSGVREGGEEAKLGTRRAA